MCNDVAADVGSHRGNGNFGSNTTPGAVVGPTHKDLFYFEFAYYDDARVVGAHETHYARVRADIAAGLWSLDGVSAIRMLARAMTCRRVACRCLSWRRYGHA